MGGTPLHKVLVIGAGAQGNVVAGVLSKADDVGAVVLADIDRGRASETAANLGSAKIRTGRVDAGPPCGPVVTISICPRPASMSGGAFRSSSSSTRRNGRRPAGPPS